MDIFLQKLQAVTNPTAFAAVFPQVVIIPYDGNLGKGVRSFKEGMNNMEKEIEEEPVKKE